MPIFHRNLLAWRLGLPPARYNVAVERNLRVPMPDGVTLRTDHYFPKAAGSFPTVLVRTPYYGGRLLRTDPPGLFDLFFAQRFAERGYHFLVQTTRGRFDSEGEFEPFVHEAEDGRATLEWIAGQPWFNGHLGMWGPSYLGYVQWAVAPEAPAYLKAIVPTFAGSRFSSILFPDGALGETPLQWTYMMDLVNRGRWTTIQALRQANPRALERVLGPAFDHLPLVEADTIAVGKPVPFYRDWLTHPRPDDPYWAAIDHSDRVPQITAPAHLITGWHDFFVREILADYAALKAAGRSPYLTIGPEGHGADGAMASLGPGLIWFDAHLKGDRSRLREKPVRIYVMGAEEWREMESWPPPARETRYFLHAQGRLSTERPATDSPPDSFRYDPADPTPSVGGPALTVTTEPVDNRELEARPDVLVYTTPPLANDAEVIGPVRLELYVRSSLAHTDFFGRLCDVHPDGRSFNICDGLFRVAPGKGEPQPDGSPSTGAVLSSSKGSGHCLRIEVDMWATAKRFPRGHRIRLQVSSGAHPRWSRNLGAGEPIATGTTMAVAEQTIYHDSAHPSALVLPVVRAAGGLEDARF